jgi:VCBS repeat-containing protein
VVVNYGVSDGTVTTPNTWTVTVTGVNDAATVSSYSESKTETNAAADLSTSGHISVTDVDTGQALAVARRDVAGSYGTFAIKTNGDWTYIASSAHNELTAGQQVFDQFTVTSADGTATGTVRINITGTNDAPVLSSSNPTSVDFMQGKAATANLMQIKASDADGPDSGIVFEFATHQAGDADYSQFTIDSKTGQISMLATGAQAIAADSTVTDYLFHVQAHDALGAISQTQTVDVHVNMAVHADNTATLPGGIGDWDIAPVTKDQAGSTVSDGFLLISHADPLITIHLPANINKLTFDGGGILRLSNDAGTALGHISDITEGSFAKHAINISPETTENTIIDILPNGDYTIVGASDSVYDKDLGTVDNYRRDVVHVDVNKSQSQFSLSADGQYVQMVLRDPTTNVITGTTLLRDIEAVQFKDATVFLAAGNGYLTAADAIANNDVSQSSAYIFEPLTSVYHPY